LPKLGALGVKTQLSGVFIRRKNVKFVSFQPRWSSANEIRSWRSQRQIYPKTSNKAHNRKKANAKVLISPKVWENIKIPVRSAVLSPVKSKRLYGHLDVARQRCRLVYTGWTKKV